MEDDADLAEFDSWLDNPPPDVVDAYAAIGRLPGAVGLDERGRLVQVPLEGGPPVVIRPSRRASSSRGR